MEICESVEELHTTRVKVSFPPLGSNPRTQRLKMTMENSDDKGWIKMKPRKLPTLVDSDQDLYAKHVKDVCDYALILGSRQSITLFKRFGIGGKRWFSVM